MLQPKYEKFYFSMEAKQRFDGWSCSPALLDLVGYGRLAANGSAKESWRAEREQRNSIKQGRKPRKAKKAINGWMKWRNWLISCGSLAPLSLEWMNEDSSSLLFFLSGLGAAAAATLREERENEKKKSWMSEWMEERRAEWRRLIEFNEINWWTQQQRRQHTSLLFLQQTN